jgi:uncharacterized protein
MFTESWFTVTLVYSPAARKASELTWQVPAGTTLGQALATPQAQTVLSGLDLATVSLGVWGRKAVPTRVLRAQDRIEIYRALKVNPKVARRERFAKQGARTTGLFAKKRAGAKAGY